MPGFFAIVASTATSKGDKLKQEEQGLFSGALTWIVYIVMSTLGALANYADKIDKGEKFSITTLILRWVIAAFASSIMALYGESQEWDKRFIFIVCGIAGYMGVTAIKMGENILKQRFGGSTPPEDKKE